MTAHCRPYCSLFAAVILCAAMNVHAQTSANANVTERRFLPLQTVWVLAARPRECSASKSRPDRQVGGNVGWGQVKASDTAQRCTRLAQGLTRVNEQPNEVLAWFPPEVASSAHLSEPPRAHEGLWLAERSLLARAWLRNGEVARAYAEFEAVQAQSPIANWHPFAVHDFAVSASRSAHFGVAVTCYRRLASLAAWLPVDMRTNVLVEGAAALLHVTPARAPEALSMLDELEFENRASDVAWMVAALRLVAKEVIEPAKAIVALPPRVGNTTVKSPRFADEDVRFFDVLASYTDAVRWSKESQSEHQPSEKNATGEGGVQVNSPAHLAVLARARAAP